MKADLKSYTDAAEERLKSHTAGQINAAEVRLKSHITRECEKLETKLAAEFKNSGAAADMRTREALRHAAALEERMLNVEDRVSAVERRRAA